MGVDMKPIQPYVDSCPHRHSLAHQKSYVQEGEGLERSAVLSGMYLVVVSSTSACVVASEASPGHFGGMAWRHMCYSEKCRFKYGAFPHAGAGIGLERVVMLCATSLSPKKLRRP
eukprot:4196857-Amphidinium_carterae.1